MIRKLSHESTTVTQSNEQQSESTQWNQPEVKADFGLIGSEYDLRSGTQIVEVKTGGGEKVTYERYAKDRRGDDDKEKNRRARANALMDSQCLFYLDMFKKNKAFHVEDMNERMEKTKDWLKISMLIRADLLETLDSTVRITPDGIKAWDSMNQLRNMKDLVRELDE